MLYIVAFWLGLVLLDAGINWQLTRESRRVQIIVDLEGGLLWYKNSYWRARRPVPDAQAHRIYRINEDGSEGERAPLWLHWVLSRACSR